MSYSPTLGRWMETDPEQYVDGANVYQMELSNPVNFTDASGLGGEPTTAPTTKPYTELPVANGVFRIQSIPYEPAGIGDPAALRTLIIFFPKKPCPICKSIRFVQITRFSDPGGHHSLADAQKGFEGLMTTEDKSKGVEAGFILDFRGVDSNGNAIVQRGKPVPQYFTSNFPSKYDSNGTSDGTNDGAQARMYDLPFAPNTSQATFEAETSAVCEQTGKVLATIKWGFTIGKNGKLTVTPPTASDTASATFDSARAAFNGYFGNK